MIIVGLGAVGVLLLTWLGFPTAAPIAIGLIMGLVRPGGSTRRAAVAGTAAWGCVLLASVVNGSAVGDTSAKLGGAMGLPGWAPLAATLLYPAILAASAAWLGQLLSSRRKIPAAGSPVAASRRDV